MSDLPDHKPLNQLRAALNRLAAGAIGNITEIEQALAKCWKDFEGSDENGMAGYKLIGRMESVQWQPPILSFAIERHGSTVLGSTRAEPHQWQIDFDQMTATSSIAGSRQVSPAAKSVRQTELQIVADEIAGLIKNGGADPRLNWKDSDTVHVVMETIIPAQSGYKRTIEGRHKRLRQALEQVLGKDGWAHVGRNVFGRKSG